MSEAQASPVCCWFLGGRRQVPQLLACTQRLLIDLLNEFQMRSHTEGSVKQSHRKEASSPPGEEALVSKT